MSNLFVSPHSNGDAKGFLGWKNDLPFASFSGSIVDPDYPIKNLFDHVDQTEFSHENFGGAQELVFNWAVARQINYFGLVSKNCIDSALVVTVQYYDTISGTYVDLCAPSFSRNGQPYAYYCGNDFEDGYIATTSIKVVTSSQSKAYVFAMHCGLAQPFYRPPDVGYQPGQLAPLDEVTQARAYGNNFMIGYRESKGYQEKARYAFTDAQDTRAWVPEFQDHVMSSKGLFYCSNTDRPFESIYGRQNPDSMMTPKYEHSLYMSIDFDIKGYA